MAQVQPVKTFGHVLTASALKGAKWCEDDS